MTRQFTYDLIETTSHVPKFENDKMNPIHLFCIVHFVLTLFHFDFSGTNKQTIFDCFLKYVLTITISFAIKRIK